ncbi:MAG TPA: hypothetical protein VGM17_11955 [Rhizomicrobium sp.]|jgi:hypothetical protein
MKIASIACTLAVGLLVALSWGTPAFAQATRTWVSGVGDDANPCSRTAPCKTFPGALSKTAPGGEINCLDAGGFGNVTITKSISIICEVEAGVLASGATGVLINAASTDRVLLDGLDIEGLGAGTNVDGIKILSAGVVYIRNCSIRRFTGNGVNLNSTTNPVRALIQDSFIVLNGGGVHVMGNANVASLTHTVVDGNTNFAVQADGTGNIVAAANSVLTGTAAISLLNGGTADSFGPSNVVSGSSTFTTTAPFK